MNSATDELRSVKRELNVVSYVEKIENQESCLSVFSGLKAECNHLFIFRALIHSWMNQQELPRKDIKILALSHRFPVMLAFLCIGNICVTFCHVCGTYLVGLTFYASILTSILGRAQNHGRSMDRDIQGGKTWGDCDRF